MLELNSIGFSKENAVIPLPSWATYLVRLGTTVVDNLEPGKRTVIGVTLPTRAYAAALCTLGVASSNFAATNTSDARNHFDWLASLPQGVQVRYRDGHYLKCGMLIGAVNFRGLDYIKIGSDVIYMRPWNKCLEIQILEPGEEFINRRVLTANPEFVEACAPGIDALTRASFSVLDAVLVGIKSVLEREILRENFFAPVYASAQKKGVLNDLLRCDAFERNANDHDRIALVSASSSELPEKLEGVTPPAVIFDGPLAYLRLRRKWKRSPLIAIFDRTSPSVSAATDAFNQEYALSTGDVDLSSLGAPPSEFEVVAYREAVR